MSAPEIPAEAHFVRDHFAVPQLEPRAWALSVDGRRSLVLPVQELRGRPAQTLRVVLECAGHRRTEFEPSPPGLPWGPGAVSEACWTGTSLAAVLEQAGIPSGARYVVLEGADAGQFPGVGGEHRFARSLPLDKALDRDVILAWAMDGEAIPLSRGGPVRAIVPGWYATDSIKWLSRIWFTEGPFDGPFEALDYRLQPPGTPGPGERMTALPVASLITGPVEGSVLPAGPALVRGIAWGGEEGVGSVRVRIDHGPWQAAQLTHSVSRYARTFWELRCELQSGRHEISSQAVDGAGNAQPSRPAPNVGGYGNNAVHRVTVDVTA